MREIGFILFIIGITTALICAAKLPPIGMQWSDVISIYIIAISLATIGLLLTYFFKKNIVNQVDKSTERRCPQLMELLNSLLKEMRTLAKEIHQLDAITIAIQVDHLMDTYLVPFTAEREEILFRLGKVRGMKTLLVAAQGEHLLNRTWSAASDGHLAEVYAIYPQALSAFEQALEQCEYFN
jgi:hypothetical protein